MYLKVHTYMTRITREPVSVPSGFNWETDQFDEGEWVAVDANGAAAHVTTDPVTHLNVFPLFTGTSRQDVRFVDGLTVIKGSFVGETDNFTGTPAINGLLTVETNGGSPDQGRLRAATTGEIVIAVVEKAAVSGTNGLIFRRLEGYGVAP